MNQELQKTTDKSNLKHIVFWTCFRSCHNPLLLSENVPFPLNTSFSEHRLSVTVVRNQVLFTDPGLSRKRQVVFRSQKEQSRYSSFSLLLI